MDDATLTLKSEVARLEERVRTLSEERDRLATQAIDLSTSAEAATGQLTGVQTTIQQQKSALTSYANELLPCEEEEARLSSREANLTKKVDILEKWTAACEDAFGELG